MTKLKQLFTEQGQSPWLDSLSRAYLRDGTLARYLADGVRGVTGYPAIFARAIEGSATAFEDHGCAERTLDTGISGAAEVIEQLAGLGIDMDGVGSALKEQGVASFHDSFARVLAALGARTGQLAQD